MSRGASVAGLAARRLYVLTGIDGAGKSTALRRVAALRQEWAVGSYDPQDWLPQPELPDFDGFLERHPRELAADLSPPERDEFLARLILAHWRHWVRPRLESCRVVLLDSFHYRFRVKQALAGGPTRAMTEAVVSLPTPRAVVLLELEPRRAARRKLSFDRHECLEERTVEGFVRFQTVLGRELGGLCGTECRDLITVDGSGSIEDVVERLIDLVERRLQGGAGC